VRLPCIEKTHCRQIPSPRFWATSPRCPKTLDAAGKMPVARSRVHGALPTLMPLKQPAQCPVRQQVMRPLSLCFCTCRQPELECRPICKNVRLARCAPCQAPPAGIYKAGKDKEVGQGQRKKGKARGNWGGEAWQKSLPAPPDPFDFFAPKRICCARKKRHGKQTGMDLAD
jgi:hypothetical protein